MENDEPRQGHPDGIEYPQYVKDLVKERLYFNCSEEDSDCDIDNMDPFDVVRYAAAEELLNGEEAVDFFFKLLEDVGLEVVYKDSSNNFF